MIRMHRPDQEESDSDQELGCPLTDLLDTGKYIACNTQYRGGPDQTARHA